MEQEAVQREEAEVKRKAAAEAEAAAEKAAAEAEAAAEKATAEHTERASPTTHVNMTYTRARQTKNTPKDTRTAK